MTRNIGPWPHCSEPQTQLLDLVLRLAASHSAQNLPSVREYLHRILTQCFKNVRENNIELHFSDFCREIFGSPLKYFMALLRNDARLGNPVRSQSLDIPPPETDEVARQTRTSNRIKLHDWSDWVRLRLAATSRPNQVATPNAHEAVRQRRWELPRPCAVSVIDWRIERSDQLRRELPLSGPNSKFAQQATCHSS